MRIYRWTAVAVGFVGVIVMLWPHLDFGRYTGAAASAAALGALFALASAFTNAGSVVQTRRLTDTETTSSIVFYFSLFCAIGGLLTLPFGWIVPTWPQLAALVVLGVLGGVSHSCSPKATATHRPRWSRRSTTRQSYGRSSSATGSSTSCRPSRSISGP